MSGEDDKPIGSMKEAWGAFSEGFKEEMKSKDGAIESLKSGAGYLLSGELAEKINPKK